MINYLQKVFKIEFFQNFIKVFSGNAIAQILPLLFTPIFARVFETEDYGNFALFMTFSTFIGSISALRFELPIVPAKENKEARILYNLSFRFVVLISALSLVICIIIFKSKLLQLGFVVLLIPFGIFFTGFYNTARMWCVRNSRFSVLSISVVIGVIIGILTKFFWGFFFYSNNGLIYSFLISKALTLFILVWKNEKVLSAVAFRDLRKIASRHKKLPYFNLPQVLLDAVQNHGFILFISSFYTQEAVGQYYMAARFVRLPATYLGSAFTPVFFQKISQKVNSNENVYAFTLKFILLLLAISVPVFLTFTLFGSSIFSIILGAKWELAGVIASYLSVWMLFKFVSSPISQIPIIFEKNEGFLKITIVYNLILLLAFAISTIQQWNLQQTLLAISILGSIVLALTTVWILKITKNEV